MVSREFADARENRPDARSAMNRHNNEAGRVVSSLIHVFAVSVVAVLLLLKVILTKLYFFLSVVSQRQHVSEV